MASCCVNCLEWILGGASPDEAEGNEKEKDFHLEEEEDDGGRVPRSHEDILQPIRVVRRQLFNLHGFNLAVFPGGIVKGVREAFSPNAVLQVITVSLGEVILRGFESGTYVAMDQRGRIYAEEDPGDDRVRFMEHAMGNHLTYLNKKYAHMGWYLGLKKSGEAKRGELTSYPWPQKAILFTHRDSHPKPLTSLQLKNKHGFYLRIKALKVSGTRNAKDQHTLIELIPGAEGGSFRLHALMDDSYVAMSPQGRLYGDKESSNRENVFLQHSNGQYFEYLSHRWAHKGWYLGIKQSGKSKRGKKTFYPTHQNAIQFLHQSPSLSV